MTSYVPEVVKTKATELNDSYNPLAAANQPSEAHGQYMYAKGIAEQSYGEATQSTSWVSTGASDKARGVAEIQAAKAGKSAREFREMVENADPSGAIGAGNKVLGEVGSGVGSVAGEGVKAGSAVTGGVWQGGKGVGGGLVDGGKGIGQGVVDGGKGVGEGLMKGGEHVGGMGKESVDQLGNLGKGTAQGVGGVGKSLSSGVQSGLGGLGFGKK